MKKFDYSIVCPCGFSKLVKETFVKAFGVAYQHEETCKQINSLVRIN